MMNTTISTASLTKMVAFGAALALLVLILGGAVAERVQHRAASDRLFLGDLRDASSIQALRVASDS